MSPKPVMAVLSIGLTPISPVIDVVPVADIPDFERMAKLPAVPSSTGSGFTALAICDRKSTEIIKPNNFRYALSIFTISRLIFTTPCYEHNKLVPIYIVMY